MKAIFVILLLGLSFLQLSGQTITNVVAVQEGDNAVITYNLDCDGSADIALYYSEDNGSSFKGPLKTVSGDVGERIRSGTNKRISWSVLKDQEILFGANIIFRVTGFYRFGKFTDGRDNKTYRIVQIGDQVWMAENLAYKTQEGSWCYKNEDANCNLYGRLYNWETALAACPQGWHMPSDEEWTKLTEFLGGNDFAGGKMKQVGTAYWKSLNNAANNHSGFSALAGGYRYEYGAFRFITESAYFWTSTQSDAAEALFCRLTNNSEIIDRNFYSKTYGFSCRCIHN